MGHGPPTVGLSTENYTTAGRSVSSEIANFREKLRLPPIEKAETPRTRSASAGLMFHPIGIGSADGDPAKPDSRGIGSVEIGRHFPVLADDPLKEVPAPRFDLRDTVPFLHGPVKREGCGAEHGKRVPSDLPE